MWLSLKSPATEVRVVPKHHRFSCAWADPSASSAAIAVEAVVVMEGNLDDLMRFLLEEIALCGQQGMSAVKFVILVKQDSHIKTLVLSALGFEPDGGRQFLQSSLAREDCDAACRFGSQASTYRTLV